MRVVYFAVEGRTDVPVAERLIQSVGCHPQQAIVAGSKSRLDPRIPALNQSGTHLNWLILRDLDRDAPCASRLVPQLVGAGTRHSRIAVRVPIRAVESWLLADHEGMTREFLVPRHHVPSHPDSLDDPKEFLVNLCRRSRSADVRTAMVPRKGSGRQVGPEYTDRVSMFALHTWDPIRAGGHSPSLRRTIAALRRLASDGVWI